VGAGLGWISAAWKGNDGSRNGGKRQKNITNQPFWGDILLIKWDTEPFESHLGLSSNGVWYTLKWFQQFLHMM